MKLTQKRKHINTARVSCCMLLAGYLDACENSLCTTLNCSSFMSLVWAQLVGMWGCNNNNDAISFTEGKWVLKYHSRVNIVR